MQKFSLIFGALVLVAGCSSEFVGDKNDGGVVWTEAGPVWPEASVGQCTPGADSDGDGINDEVEGCSTDTDNDKIPDYADTDSDNDKVPDRVEGLSDRDGDKIPAYKDTDSDNDGVNDGNEDLNGDGKLGCCLAACNEKRPGCTIEPGTGGCGKGQKCQGGQCAPPVDFLCSNGETDPAKKSTFPGGKSDKDLPNFICHPPGETGSKGLKPMQFKSNSKGNWKVAIETTSLYGPVAIAGAGSLEAGASFDLKGNNQAVAGFIVSMPSPGGDATAVASKLINKLQGLPGKASITQLSSGTPKTSHDGFPMVVSTQLAIKMSGAKNPPAVRNALFGVLLGKPVSQLPQANFGPPQADHVLRFQTLLRPKTNRVIVMGAVGAANMVNNPAMNTGIHMDDLSNGTGLATASDTDTVECDPFILTGTPVADIIWVVDESGSMYDNRADVAANATDFFSRAVKSGLDFRMAVTNVCNPTGTYGYAVGKFCSQSSTDTKHNGGADRFLQPNEQPIFEACVKNPPGYEGGSEYGLQNARDAVTKHLPRKAGDPMKIRPNAALVIIHATDEAPQTWKSAGGGYSYYKTCVLPAAMQTTTNNFVAPDIALFTGKDPKWGAAAKATVHMIGGVCNNTCNAEIGHGYKEVVQATGGTSADVCQKNLGATLQIIIDSITGLASPAKLQYVPISASLAVAIDKQQLKRSRQNGFDYSASANTLIFIGVPFPKGSQVVASYRRYKKQGPQIE
jgi:hypothetical protein